MSKQYENEIAKMIYRETGNEIRAYRCGYSGSNAMPQPDILVTIPGGAVGMELKGPIASDEIYIDGEDLEQLAECTNGDTIVALVVKFQRRKPLVVRFYDVVMGGDAEWDDMGVVEKFEAMVPECFDSTVTGGGNLRLRKPSTDEWPSARVSEDDHIEICAELGIPTNKAHIIELP